MMNSDHSKKPKKKHSDHNGSLSSQLQQQQPLNRNNNHNVRSSSSSSSYHNNNNHHQHQHQHQQQQQQHSHYSRRRRLSHPMTQQQQHQPLSSRLQPLSVVPVVLDTTFPTPMNAVVVVEASTTTSSSSTTATPSPNQPPPPLEERKDDENDDELLQQLYSFVVSLAESCRKHTLSAHSHHTIHNSNATDDVDITSNNNPTTTATSNVNSTSSSTTTSQSLLCLPLTKAPSYCQDAIHTLQERILPHVETTLLLEMKKITRRRRMSSNRSTTTTTSTTLNSLRNMTEHMCDFFMDVLQHGSKGFCPQAPHLLLHPQQILPRVHLLFYALATQATPTFWEMEANDAMILQQMMKICHTVATILNHIPYISMIRRAISDLIYLAKDLSVWYEMININCADTTSDKSQQMNISIFEETIDMVDWSNINYDHTKQNDSGDEMTKPEYIIHIPKSSESIRAMQWCTFIILEHLLTLNKEQRRRSSPTYATGMITEELDPINYLPCMGHDPDLFIIQHIDDVDDIRTLMIPFREILLSSRSTHNIVATTYALHSVTSLLIQVQSDLDRSHLPNISLLQEVVLLIGYGIRYYLEVLPTIANHILTHHCSGIRTGLIDTVNTTTAHMTHLLSNLLYNPPNVAGTMSLQNVTTRIYQMSYETLFESVPCIQRGTIDVIAPSGGPNHHIHTNTISTVLLRTILAMQCTTSTGGTGTSVPMHNVALIQTLFQLLDDPLFSDIVVFILAGILVDNNHGLSTIIDVENALTNSYAESTTIPMEPAVSISHEMPLGSKRQLVEQSTSNGCCAQKRYKLDPLVGHDVFIWHNELYQYFYDHTRRGDPISRLKAEVYQAKIPFTDTIQSDFHQITSRLRLILLLVQRHYDNEAWVAVSSVLPHVLRYVNDAMSLISMIADRLFQNDDNYHQDENLDTNIGHMVEFIVISGVFIAKSSWLESSGLIMARDSACRSIMILAHRWNMFPNCEESSNMNSSFELKSTLHNVLLGFACHCKDKLPISSLRSTWIMTVQFMAMSVIIDARNLNDLTMHWTGPFLKPIDDDIQNQKVRLTAIVRRSQLTQLQSLSIESVQTLSLDTLLQNPKWDHYNPFRRLMLWQTGAWIMRSIPVQDLHQWSRRHFRNGKLIGIELLNFLIDTAFLDSDATVLEYTSRELGNVLSCKQWTCVLSLTSSDDEWQHVQSQNSGSTSNYIVDDILSRMFRYIEDIFPFDRKSKKVVHESSSTKSEQLHKSAARTLCSLFIAKPHEVNEMTKIVIRSSIKQAVRQWSLLQQPTSRHNEMDGYYLAELLRISHCTDFGATVLTENWQSFAPVLLQNLFAPYSNDQLELTNVDLLENTRPEWKERQFSVITSFIHTILAERLGGEPHVSSCIESELEKFVDSSLPNAIAEFVLEKNYDGLQMMSSYKLYILGQRRSRSKMLKRLELLSFQNDPISGFVLGDLSKNSTAKLWNRDLENHTRQLCLAPGLVEQITPLIFMYSEEEMTFFTQTVLQKKISLKQLVTSREMLTLKNFVLELGRNPKLSEQTVVAMTKAAIVRSEKYKESSTKSTLIKLVQSNDDAVKSWITANFMFLLVNVVQYKWSIKTTTQQVASLTSLLTILNFLQPLESSQYLPQIMATVNTALSDNPESISIFEDASQFKQIRLLAIQVLSKFVQLLAPSQLDVLGQNLTSVVVSLIPIFTSYDNQQNHALCEEVRHGVSLLEWLSSQESLQHYFEEIPFLPQTPPLDSVRARLKARGVHFDNLLSVTTQATYDGTTGTRSVASESGSTGGDSHGVASHALRQAALRRRLETVSPLLENDSASVRRVALMHLTSLLRCNRELFHSLIENEGTTSLKRFVTVSYRDKNGKSRWNITDFIHTILSRCLKENDHDARLLLATCFGEVGAISANFLEETKTTHDAHSRITCTPPWYSAPHLLGLQLVSTHLVAALKAASSSSDQHKIAFAIQQLLALLNEAGKAGIITAKQNNDHSRVSGTSTSTLGNTNKPKMDKSLIHALVEADVIDVVEPFWFSEFHEAEANDPKPFPFFRSSSSYFMWLSDLCRYMVHIAYGDRKTEWTMMFHACRTALRTKAGLGVADCLLPYLVLDCICFGGGEDRAMILSEMRDVLTFDDNSEAKLNEVMPLTDRRNAVNIIFGVVDGLQMWIEPETDARFSRRIQNQSKSNDPDAQVALTAKSDWQRDESAMRIEDMMKELPLNLRGKAAFCVGMHANALRCLEMASRVTVVESVFGDESLSIDSHKYSRSRAAGSCPEEAVSLLKDVLASLNDYETIGALVDDNVWDVPTAQTRDSIRQKEALHDWQGALHDYERAQQLSVGDPTLRIGVIKCLLELGHFDSVLHQVSCMKITKTQENSVDFFAAVPLAVEASWRLGRWETLSELVETETKDFAEPDALYQMHLGRALLSIQKKNHESAILSLTRARSAVMDILGNVARESYSRSYGHVVRLQAIREIEDVSTLLCSTESSSIGQYSDECSLGWNRRLELVSSLGATSITNTRLVLARLSNDTAFEGSLFLQMGKRARKSGLLGAAGNAFSQAEAAFRFANGNQKAKLKCSLQLQFAKLKYDSGESSIALRMLGQEDIETMGILKKDELVTKSCRRVLDNLGISRHEMDEEELLSVFVRSALQSTRWMIDGGLKEGAEILARFRIIHCLAPTFEKGHFQFAKYVDSLLQSRILALLGRMPDHATGTNDEKLRNLIVSRDKACIRYVVLAIRHYAEALVLDAKHVYQALPRLLSLWFDFTSIPSKKIVMLHSSDKEISPELDSLLGTNQDEINAFMASTYRKISAQTLYTAIPQLISRIIHNDVDTASVVQAILRRVLTKYPAQAMWPLSWIRQSRDPQRQQIGFDIFSQVTEALLKSDSLHRLLVTSKTLIDYLYALAKKEVSDKIKDSMRVRPLSNEVDLCEFVPPIQAALSASLVSGDSSRSRDVFPRHIPRMRAIDEIVGVMSSKARPKKVRVYVVAAESMVQLRYSGRNGKLHDIGEIHFLLKQEEKGDLRKDARVQDLNNVINRMMSSMDKMANVGLGQTRRLHLRTFCVTCLSEETGLLEWVPHTASLRTMIAKTYNPQASSIHGKRQGKRITNFTDPQMRSMFENVCQAAFFVSGDLTKAAALFEMKCLVAYPPILYWWYVLQFPDPHAWYEARTRFALSTAAWSAVGHVIGLGDRHSENILLDKTTGECVHVDFDCIFDKGLHLPKPEIVPFRLTQNMVDALGPTGADGIYSWNLKAAMSALRDNRDTLLSVLEPFVKDPVINWKRYRSQQQASLRDITSEAKQKMSVIDERLRGIYNLRNNNLKKIRRVDRIENQEDDELHHPIPLSVEGQVHKMIAEATSAENLVQMYVGWMPWV